MSGIATSFNSCFFCPSEAPALRELTALVLVVHVSFKLVLRPFCGFQEWLLLIIVASSLYRGPFLPINLDTWLVHSRSWRDLCLFLFFGQKPSSCQSNAIPLREEAQIKQLLNQKVCLDHEEDGKKRELFRQKIQFAEEKKTKHEFARKISVREQCKEKSFCLSLHYSKLQWLLLSQIISSALNSCRSQKFWLPELYFFWGWFDLGSQMSDFPSYPHVLSLRGGLFYICIQPIFHHSSRPKYVRSFLLQVL